MAVDQRRAGLGQRFSRVVTAKRFNEWGGHDTSICATVRPQAML